MLNFLIDSFGLTKIKLISGLAFIVIIISAFTYTYYKGYNKGKDEAEKEINHNYVQIIKRINEENQDKMKIETQKYVDAINKNNELQKIIEEKKKDVKNFKSKSLTNKACELEKEDVTKINNYIEVLNVE